MFTVTVLRTFRRCVVPQPLGHVTAARRVAALSAACFRGQSLQSAGLQSRGLCERSFLNLNYKVQSRCQSARCVSTATHSDDGNLVYTGSLGTAVRGVKLFSYSTSGVSLLLMPHILLKTGLVVQSIAMKAAFCGIVGFFTFLTPVVLHLITKGYVARLYHHPDRDTYTAITYSVLLTEKKTVFHQRQVRIPAISQMFTTFYAGNTGLLVNPDMFPVPHDYNHLMGYDQPFSFNTDDMDPPDRSRTSD